MARGLVGLSGAAGLSSCLLTGCLFLGTKDSETPPPGKVPPSLLARAASPFPEIDRPPPPPEPLSDYHARGAAPIARLSATVEPGQDRAQVEVTPAVQTRPATSELAPPPPPAPATSPPPSKDTP